jgi:hypothetical protein
MGYWWKGNRFAGGVQEDKITNLKAKKKVIVPIPEV